MLETFTISTFSNRLNEPFQLFDSSGAPLVLTLTQVDSLSEQRGLPVKRSPFSLIFTGPPQPVLPQKTYRVDHSSIGTFEIFIVPIGPSAQGMQYEAIFS